MEDKKRRRVAVCLTGIPKYCKNSIESIKKLGDNVDVFIHAWIVDDSSQLKNGVTSSEKSNIYGIGGHPQSYNTYENFIENDLAKLYSPKYCKVEKLDDYLEYFKKQKELFLQIDGVKSKNNICQKSIGLVSMFYGIEKACELKKQYEDENNFKYDVVFRMRFDSDIPNWHEWHYSIIDNKNLIIPDPDRDFGATGHGEGINDQFWYGPSELYDKSANVYSNLFDIITKCKAYHPETIFKNHIRSCIGDDLIKRVELNVEINNNKNTPPRPFFKSRVLSSPISRMAFDSLKRL